MQDNDAPGADDLVRAVPADDSQLATDGDDGDDACRIEHEGQVYEIPSELKGAFLRQADYTRKTQELAQHRRALIAERQAVAAEAQAADDASGIRLQLAALDHQLTQLGGVDWQGFAAQDPRAAQALWGRFHEMAQARGGLAQAAAHHAERNQMQAAREAAAKMAETGRALQQEIEGWSPEVAAKLVEYAKAFGVTHEELTQMADPRLWKVLHKAYQADQTSQAEGAASAAAKAQAVRPAVLVSGSAPGGGAVRDELATKEWMNRRNAQLRKGR
ncbi:hypothetical protein [Phenylobacterium sp.]|uniref:hypothetical protein n=1 Tax=Phenylobacterium sp. TaxID=1871053 RepID=UPI003564047F